LEKLSIQELLDCVSKSLGYEQVNIEKDLEYIMKMKFLWIRNIYVFKNKTGCFVEKKKKKKNYIVSYKMISLKASIDNSRLIRGCCTLVDRQIHTSWKRILNYKANNAIFKTETDERHGFLLVVIIVIVGYELANNIG